MLGRSALAGERRARAALLPGLVVVVLAGLLLPRGARAQPPSPSPSASPSTSPCPAPCSCWEADGTVWCVGQNLTAVPRGLPGWARALLLSGNRIGGLPGGAFARSRPLQQLRRLALSGNGLAWVGEGALAGLPRLASLDLSHNRLAALSPAAFGNGSSPVEELDLSDALADGTDAGALLAGLLRPGALPRLQRLDLSDNRLLALPPDAFAGLPSLQHLDLHDSSLDGAGLHQVDFSRLPRLQSLNLSGNALRALSNATLAQLRGLPRLASLDLGRNPWRCDCRLHDLLGWLRESEAVVEAKESLRCAGPGGMQGRPLVSLRLSGLDCPLPGGEEDQAQLQTSYVFLGIVLALIGAIFLLVLYLNRKGIKKWLYNIRDACRDHMEGYHYRYEISTAQPHLTTLSSSSDV